VAAAASSVRVAGPRAVGPGAVRSVEEPGLVVLVVDVVDVVDVVEVVVVAGVPDGVMAGVVVITPRYL
jgi:hypothetical protein